MEKSGGQPKATTLIVGFVVVVGFLVWEGVKERYGERIGRALEARCGGGGGGGGGRETEGEGGQCEGELLLFRGRPIGAEGVL